MAIGDGVTTDGTALSGGQKAMKYSLFAINLVYLIFAIVLIALGAAAAKDLAGQLSNNTLPDGIIVMGVFLLLVSLFGFFSAWKEWRPGLGIFAAFVLLLAIILIAVSIAVYVEKNNANYYITTGWTNGGTNVQISVMAAFSCCGLTDPSSVYQYCGIGRYPATGGGTVPTPSQCCTSNSTANTTSGYVPNYSALPCLPILISDFDSYVTPAAGAGIAFSVLMFASLVFIGMLMKGIRLKNLNLEVLKNRERNEAERAERRKGIQLPDNVL